MSWVITEFEGASECSEMSVVLELLQLWTHASLT
jgi:hypothetical protein